MVVFGPAGDALPARFTGVATSDHGIVIEVAMTFDGVRRPQVEVVTVRPRPGDGGITPADLARTQLAAAARSVIVEALRPGAIAGDDPLFVLARLYWREFVSWGSPRAAVMTLFGVPRSTANHLIRSARERFPLPGPHARDTTAVPADLERVAAVYLEHVADKPVEAVAEDLDCSRATASRRIKAAADAGLLPPTTPGRKRGAADAGAAL